MNGPDGVARRADDAMHAVVTPAEMNAIDAAADTRVDVLIERAGWAVARSARALLGGTYGRRVMVVAGPGNNGADGMVAARILSGWGVKTRVVRVDRNTPPPNTFEACDLVIDAAYGTGFRGVFVAPDCGLVPVLAVDIPSGVDGLTGSVSETSRPFICTHTCTFAALKPGLLFGAGPSYAGTVEVADIGLRTPSEVHLLDIEEVKGRVPQRARSAHKWSAAMLVVGGSIGMTGAPSLTARAAMRAGAGMVRLLIPGDPHPGAGPFGSEIVGVAISESKWEHAALVALQKCGALVVGPGLGREPATLASAAALIESTNTVPMVIDADALVAVAGRRFGERAGHAGVVLTPHDGEFRSLTGSSVTNDRIESCRTLARSANAVVLLKGPTTVIADPNGRVELVANGDSRLATAGSGDVLSGIIGALMSQGLPAFEAASTGAFVHGGAASLGNRLGFVASDIIENLPAWLDRATSSTH